MKYKRFLIEYSKNYPARIFRYPEYSFEEFDFTIHWHRDYEFVYVEKGHLKLRKLDCEIILHLPIKAIQPYFENPQDCPTFRIDSPVAKAEIASSLKNLDECKDLEGKLETLKIKAVLNNIAYYLIRDCQAPDLEFIKGSESDDFTSAKSAILYMALPQGYSADGDCKLRGNTPAHFSKYFKEKNEITFSKYLRRIRLGHALNDMAKNNASVKQAALDNGFPNVNSFILTCKDEYGKTPLEMKDCV